MCQRRINALYELVGYKIRTENINDYDLTNTKLYDEEWNVVTEPFQCNDLYPTPQYGLDKVREFLYGVIVLKNGTWYERREYDGSEWWKHCKKPEENDYIETQN